MSGREDLVAAVSAAMLTAAEAFTYDLEEQRDGGWRLTFNGGEPLYSLTYEAAVAHLRMLSARFRAEAVVTALEVAGGAAVPAFDRTFRVGQHAVSTVREMLPRAGLVSLVFVEPKVLERLPGGGTRTSIGFPALIVTDLVEDPEAFAAKVVAALNAAGPREGGGA